MNLALSLLYAAERNPKAEAVVQGETRFHLCGASGTGRAPRRRPGCGRARRGRPARSGGPTPATSPCGSAGPASGSARPACRSRIACRRRTSTTAARTRARSCPRGGPGDRAARRRPASRCTRPGRAESLMLYTSGTTGRPKGVPRSHRADRAGGLSQVIQQAIATATGRSASCRSTTRWARTR